ncbi:transposase, partial [Enterococcus faecium]|uniref:transposase n=3 Tax=Enterococcus TaxID=1350 RepID=UPI001EFAF2B5
QGIIGNPSLNHRYRKGFYSLFKTLQQNPFFKRLIKQFGEPKVLVTDKAPSLSSAFNQLHSEGLFSKTEHRTNKYLNNIIEQDHRSIKKRHKLYQSIRTASSTIKGIETIHALYKISQRDKSLFGFSVIHEMNTLMSI